MKHVMIIIHASSGPSLTYTKSPIGLKTISLRSEDVTLVSERQEELFKTSFKIKPMFIKE